MQTYRMWPAGPLPISKLEWCVCVVRDCLCVLPPSVEGTHGIKTYIYIQLFLVYLCLCIICLHPLLQYISVEDTSGRPHRETPPAGMLLDRGDGIVLCFTASSCTSSSWRKKQGGHGIDISFNALVPPPTSLNCSLPTVRAEIWARPPSSS